jgi:hypothetical protein
MEFGKADGNVLWTFFSLSNHDYGPNAFDISTEGDAADEFIAGFKLNKIEDVDHLVEITVKVYQHFSSKVYHF